MGHPHDPITHSHHNSVWISHSNVGGVDFWGDQGQGKGRIVHQRVLEYWDGDDSAGMRSINHWIADGADTPLLEETRQTEIVDADGGGWYLIIDLLFSPPEGGAAVTFQQTAFGLIGVRVAKPIGVHDGGGRTPQLPRRHRRRGNLPQARALGRLLWHDHRPASGGDHPHGLTPATPASRPPSTCAAMAGWASASRSIKRSKSALSSHCGDATHCGSTTAHQNPRKWNRPSKPSPSAIPDAHRSPDAGTTSRPLDPTRHLTPLASSDFPNPSPPHPNVRIATQPPALNPVNPFSILRNPNN